MLPDLVRTIDLPRMVAYAGATWDWHRLHYDRDHVAALGLAAPVVDGQLLGALMAEHALDWAGPDARLLRLSVRYRAMVFAGDTVTVSGEVTGERSLEEAREVTVDQRVTVGDRLAAAGACTLLVAPVVG